MGHTCRGCLLIPTREEEEHAGEAADVLKPQRGQKWVRLDTAYLLVVGTMTERHRFADDEEFREVVARGTEILGKVGGKLHEVEGITLGGRGTQEPSCSRISTEAPR